ncbi:hypothetical protein Ddye_006756 [Dipteronia dyeriana]|uniref:Uncharacterized protein n=1 Tax=Dipteronia dyeriana TaxID=168575 RepID=A0AAE0CRH1_9ROSI|nr:hypothetical protein Ddye_006756 [Dipteronia dyeriana]
MVSCNYKTIYMYIRFCLKEPLAGNPQPQKSSNMSSTEETQEKNEQGDVKTTVETTDYRTSAGETEATPVKIGVVHLTSKDDPEVGSKGGDILTGAADAIVKTVESAKEAISGHSKDKTDKK